MSDHDHAQAGKLVTFICPIKPEAHGRSCQAYECPCCGHLVVGCVDGCSSDDILAILFPDDLATPEGA